MKICMLTTSYPRWKKDPTTPFIGQLCEELVNKDIEVNVVCPHDVNTSDYENIEGVKIHRFKYWITKKGGKLAYDGGMPYNFSHSYLAKIQLFFFILIFFLKGLRIAKKCDVVHAQFLLSGFVGILIKKITGKKLFLTIHAGGLFSLEKIPFNKKIANLIAIETDKINTVSNYIKERFLHLVSDEFSKKIKNQIIVMPMGINPDRFEKNLDLLRSSKKNNDKNLLFVGRISDKKGLSTLIDAIKILTNYTKNFNLTIVGDGPLRDKMEEKTNNLGLNEFIEFKGRISDEELTKLYLLSDIVIVPSIISDYGDTEGLPVVILEAMAAGKPVIASNVSGIPEIVVDGKTGILVRPKDETQLANEIQYLLSHQKLREEMGNYGREIICMSYSWDKIVLKTMELYRNNI